MCVMIARLAMDERIQPAKEKPTSEIKYATRPMWAMVRLREINSCSVDSIRLGTLGRKSVKGMLLVSDSKEERGEGCPIIAEDK